MKTWEDEVARAKSWFEHQLGHRRTDFYVLCRDNYGNVYGKQDHVPPLNKYRGHWNRLLGRSKGFIDWGDLWFGCSEITPVEIAGKFRTIQLVTSRFLIEKSLHKNQILYVAVGSWGGIGTFSTSRWRFDSQSF